MSSHRATDAPFTAESAKRALRDACAKAGISADGAELVHLRGNAIFTLRRQEIVVRIAPSDRLIQRAEKEISVARWLAERDYPAVRIAEEITRQPVHADGRLATFWRLADHYCTPSTIDLGILLRELHELPAPDLELPPFRPFDAIAGRLARPGSADPSAVAFLTGLWHDLEARYAALDFALPAGLIHGDADLFNVIATSDGPVLTDFEAVAWGPREWDLLPTALVMDRFGLSAQTFEEFSRKYGFDVTQWPGYPVLRSVYELDNVAWLMQIIDDGPDRRAEFEHRVSTMRPGKTGEKWHSWIQSPS